jgi:hypothetical protein
MAVQAPSSAVQEVAAAVAAAYTARGELIVETTLGRISHAAPDAASTPCVLAAGGGIIELVLDADAAPGAVAMSLWHLAEQGFDPIVLVPSEVSGRAHQELRGAPCRLQQWWWEDSEVRFGRFERP